MLLANLIKAIILGVVEGITEWLPISSTGHLILVNEFIKMDVSQEFLNMFNVVIQLGAIMAVVVLYFHKLNPFSPKKTPQQRHGTWILWFKVVVACLPGVVAGLFLDDFLEAHFQNFVTVSIMLVLYGILFILIEKRNKNQQAKFSSLGSLTYQAAFYIGLFQVLALIPGTSRSGATILGAILIGSSRFVATEFSFFLGIPMMFGASGLKVLKFIKAGNTFSGEEILILVVSSLVAFVVSVVAIKFLMSYLKKNDFTAFGWYRIILGLILLGYWILSL